MLNNATPEYINAGTVARYVRDITEGAFDRLASIITLGTGGRLLNGHHRCHAVCQSGRSIVVRVRRVEGDRYDHAAELVELAELAAQNRAESPPDQRTGRECTWPSCDCLDPPCQGFWDH
jgi:hypothetical protein